MFDQNGGWWWDRQVRSPQQTQPGAASWNGHAVKVGTRAGGRRAGAELAIQQCHEHA